MGPGLRRERRSGLLSLLLVACLGVLVATGGWVRRAGPAPEPTLPPAAGLPGNPVLAAAPAPVPRAATLRAAPSNDPGSAASTARSFLAGYYGERWGEVERAITASGVDLDRPYTFTPWEAVELEFERVFPLEKEDERRSAARPILDWPDTLTPEWIGQNYGTDPARIDGEALAAISDLASRDNQDLAVVGEEWVRGIDLHLRERWETGQYFKAPFTTLGLYQERGFFSTTSVGFGWGVSVVLKREEYPDMVEIEGRATLLRDGRDERILDYLASR